MHILWTGNRVLTRQRPDLARAGMSPAEKEVRALQTGLPNGASAVVLFWIMRRVTPVFLALTEVPGTQ